MGIPFVVIKEQLESFGKLSPVTILSQEFECVDGYHPKKPLSKKTLYLCETADLANIESNSFLFSHPSPDPFVIICVASAFDGSHTGAPTRAGSATRTNAGSGASVGAPESAPICPNAPGDAALEQQCAALSNRSVMVLFFSTNLSYERIHYRLQSKLVELISWKYDMADAMLSGAMFQEILDMSAEILPDPIYITDSRYSLVASVNTQKESLPAFQELLETGVLREETIRRLKKQGYLASNTIPRSYQVKATIAQSNSSKEKEAFVNQVFRVEGSFYLHAIMLCRQQPLSPSVRYLFEILSESIKHCVMKECYQMGGRHRAENDLILALVQGGEFDPDALDAFSRSSGVVLTKPLRLIQAKNTNRVSLDTLAGMLEKTLPACLAGQSGSALYLIINHDEVSTPKLLSELQQFCVHNKVSLGCSLPFAKAGQAYYARLQTDSLLALPAYAVAQGRGKSSRFNALSFKAHARLCLLHADSETRDELVEYLVSNNPLLPVLEEDTKRLDHNMELIAAYLQSFGNVAEVAQTLDVHRNSVYYNIARMQNRYGIDLSSLEERRYLALLLDLMALAGKLA